MDRIKFGVIGLGWFGEYHCDVLRGLPDVELYALCTRNEARLRELAGKFDVHHTHTDYHKLLEDPQVDAVSIVTMWDQHTEPTLAALRAGKHVFLEKPMAHTVKDCRTIVHATRQAKGAFMVGHICRFNPRYASAKMQIAAGKIGEVISLYSRRNIPAAWTPEILNKIGPIIGDAVHDTDLMLWFTGRKVVSAFAQTHSVRHLKHPDVAHTTYRFDNGAIATLETVWCMPAQSPFDIDERMSIIGTDGFVHVQDTYPNFSVCSKDGFRSPDTTYWPVIHGTRVGALREEFAYFTRCIREGRRPEIITPEESMEAVRVCLAAEESAALGRVVHLNEDGK